MSKATPPALKTVRNTEEFQREMFNLMEASVGVMMVRTREPFRAASEIYDIVRQQDNAEFQLWTAIRGWGRYEPDNNEARDFEGNEELVIDISNPLHVDKVIDPLKAIEKVYKDMREDNVHHNESARSKVYAMLNISHTFNNANMAAYIKQQVEDAIDFNKRLIFIEGDHVEVPKHLEDDIYVIDFKTPSYLELYEIFQGHSSTLKGFLDHFSEEDIDNIVKNAIGMTATQFDKAVGLATVELRHLFNDATTTKRTMEGNDKAKLSKEERQALCTPDLFVKHCVMTKTEVLKKTDLLEMMPSAKIEDVGGLELLKEYLIMRKDALSDEAKAFGIDTPKGILVVGPPGTGKSLIAKATAAVFNLPCIKLDVGRVFGRYVGESEGRMRSALSIIESMSPAILFIDEIDKAFGGIGSGGDSGTSSRVFGSILTWLQERDNQGQPIFVVMTANNVSGLPPELLRRGRVDDIFSVNFPNHDERIEIAQIHLRKRGHKLSNDELQSFANATDRYVGSEIEGIVKDAILACFSRDEKTVTADELVRQAAQTKPLSKAFESAVNAMQQWAENNAKPASRKLIKSSSGKTVSADDMPIKLRSKAGKSGSLRRPNRIITK